MFGTGKLLRDGVQAEGVVIESLGHDVANGGVGRKYKVKVRVQFDDGSTQEVKGHLDRFEDGWKIEGDIVPVRYDRSDHSKIAIDEPALKAKVEANNLEIERDTQERVEQAEHSLRPAATQDPAPPG